MLNNSGLITRMSANLAMSKNKNVRYIWKKKNLYLMLLPCLIFFAIFHYVPIYGIIIAFQDFSFTKGITGSEWVGLDNFRYVLGLNDFYRVFYNSILLSFLRLLFDFPIPIILAVLLNEMRVVFFKRISQTLIYLPHFISWVVLGGILVNFLSPSWGVVNNILKDLGFSSIFFLAEDSWFRTIVVASSIWKGAGWSTIIYLAAIAGVNQELYEAAYVDGASRIQRILRITLPCIRPTIIILLILNIGNLMTNGFEQIFILQNSANLHVSDVFETYTYYMGLVSGRLSFAATVGLFTSVVGMILLLLANYFAKKIGDEGIW